MSGSSYVKVQSSSLPLYERNGRYFTRRRIKGSRPWIPLNAAPPNIKDAELEIAAELTLNKNKRPAKRNVRVEDAFDQFLEIGVGSKSKLSPATIESYRSPFDQFARKKIGRMRVADVEPDHILVLREDALAVSKHRWRHLYVALNSFFGKITEPGVQYVRPDNPVKQIGSANRPEKSEITPVDEEAVVSEEEIDAIAESMIKTKEGHKCKVVWQLLPETGTRISEMLAVCRHHVVYPVHEVGARVLPEAIIIEQKLGFRFKSGDPTTWFGPVKGRQDISGSHARTIGLSPYAARTLQEYIDHAESKGWFKEYERDGEKVVLLFPNSKGKPMRSNHVWNRVQDAAIKAGVRKVTLHWMRHTFASNQLENETSIENVRDALGHSTTRVTEKRYAHRPKKAAYIAAVAKAGRQ